MPERGIIINLTFRNMKFKRFSICLSLILSRPEIDLQFLTKKSVMKGKKTITQATKKPTYQGYSYAFKIAIVERVELGQISINQASKEYEVSRSGIQKWI